MQNMRHEFLLRSIEF